MINDSVESFLYSCRKTIRFHQTDLKFSTFLLLFGIGMIWPGGNKGISTKPLMLVDIVSNGYFELFCAKYRISLITCIDSFTVIYQPSPSIQLRLITADNVIFAALRAKYQVERISCYSEFVFCFVLSQYAELKKVIFWRHDYFSSTFFLHRRTWLTAYHCWEKLVRIEREPVKNEFSVTLYEESWEILRKYWVEPWEHHRSQ